MRIKSGVWYWLAMACFVVGLLYSIGVEGTAQTLGTVSDGAFVTAMVLILLAMFFARLGFAAEAEENRRKSRHGKIKRAHARNPEYPENQERGA